SGRYSCPLSRRQFQEGLRAIEQFLSEAEHKPLSTVFLQHSTQVHIRFFITVLRQMARGDPITALLSPAVGGFHAALQS
ncbi:hypothetical protein EI94DRAFT_1142345, partial [Lactarius quietus]